MIFSSIYQDIENICKMLNQIIYTHQFKIKSEWYGNQTKCASHS